MHPPVLTIEEQSNIESGSWFSRLSAPLREAILARAAVRRLVDGAVLSTRGGVAFVGDLDRHFKAVDVASGKLLWETRLGTSVQGFPITFSVGGRQYVAVPTGVGGGSPRRVPSLLAPEIHHPGNGNALYVFALPERH